MQELFHQLGIDWRLLLSQAANFLILLVLLTFLVYRPVVRILKERKTKIADGLQKAEEAENRLQEANVIARDKVKEGEQKAMQVMREIEQKAKERENALMAEAKKKEEAMFQSAELSLSRKKEEAMVALTKEAAGMMRAAIAKAVDMTPEQVDKTLVENAAAALNK
jgi:F-type H+-transporting ATPase subunit b